MKTINEILEDIVSTAMELNKVYLPNEPVKINYSAIFCQNNEEYEQFNKEAIQFGKIAEDTPTGPIYKFQNPIQTIAGPLWLLKIRKLDPTRPQRGDADFTVEDYSSFKENHLRDTEYFKLIDRGDFEMIELKDPRFNVLCYFSNIPLIF